MLLVSANICFGSALNTDTKVAIYKSKFRVRHRKRLGPA